MDKRQRNGQDARPATERAMAQVQLDPPSFLPELAALRREKKPSFQMRICLLKARLAPIVPDGDNIFDRSRFSIFLLTIDKSLFRA